MNIPSPGTSQLIFVTKGLVFKYLYNDCDESISRKIDKNTFSTSTKLEHIGQHAQFESVTWSFEF